MKHLLTAILVAIVVGIIVYVADNRLSILLLMLILAVAIYIVSRISEALIKKYSKENS
ncbi:hypothetical protein [Bacillus safensis]|uniref:hypothetical protein n=1 Tax=Bacillus safensis TaxID=561879 RepID=UPI0021AE32DC|nr:hypothetical protein [Bacillus safensis]